MRCFWAAFPLISFSSEIPSSPSSAADGTIYFQGCSQSEGCRQLSGALWVFATWFYSCRQGWEKEHLHFAATKLSEPQNLGPHPLCAEDAVGGQGGFCPLVFCAFGLKVLRGHSLRVSCPMPRDRHTWTRSQRPCGQTFSQTVKPSPERARGWWGLPSKCAAGQEGQARPQPCCITPDCLFRISEGQALGDSAPVHQPPGLLQPALHGAPCPPLSWSRCSLLREPPPQASV